MRCRAAAGADPRRPGFAGTMTFTLPETLWLAEQGYEDLLLAYPTTDGGALEELALRSAAHPEQAPIVTVDSPEHLDQIESVLGAGAAPVRVCIELDASWWAAGGRCRPRRDVGERGRDAGPGAARSRSGSPSKSVRCRALLERDPAPRRRFAGLMTFTLPETLWLAEQGLRGPAARLPDRRRRRARGAGAALGRQPAGAPIVMVDCVEHLDAIESVLGAGRRRSASASTSTRAGGRWAAGSRSAPSARRSTPSSRRSRWRGTSSGGRRSTSSR